MSNKGNKHDRKSKGIPSQTTQIPFIPPHELTILGISGTNPERPYVALKYYDESHQCLSDWTQEELRSLSKTFRHIRSMTWHEIMRTGGRIKTGLGCTVHKDRSKLPAIPELSHDLSFIEFRVTEKARIHGFRVGEAFFLCWLDRNHEIYPD